MGMRSTAPAGSRGLPSRFSCASAAARAALVRSEIASRSFSARRLYFPFCFCSSAVLTAIGNCSANPLATSSMRFGGLIIDTVVCLTLAKWETVSGQFGGYFSRTLDGGRDHEAAGSP